METITRGTPGWKKFVARQRRRVKARLQRYLSVAMAQKELAATGDLTPYRSYKTEVVVPLLNQAIDRMNRGEYGMCIVCQCEIPVERLRAVPGALACVGCDDKRK